MNYKLYLYLKINHLIIKNMNNTVKLQHLITQYNIHPNNVKIKYCQDYSIICTIWFVSISVNNITTYGQSRYKDDAISTAIDRLSIKMTQNRT